MLAISLIDGSSTTTQGVVSWTVVHRFGEAVSPMDSNPRRAGILSGDFHRPRASDSITICVAVLQHRRDLRLLPSVKTARGGPKGSQRATFFSVPLDLAFSLIPFEHRDCASPPITSNECILPVAARPDAPRLRSNTSVCRRAHSTVGPHRPLMLTTSRSTFLCPKTFRARQNPLSDCEAVASVPRVAAGAATRTSRRIQLVAAGWLVR